MDVRNRMADVVKLRCNVCQEFLKLVVVDDWKNKLYDRAEHQIENNLRYKDNYKPIYDRMRDIGKEQYSIDNDMDVTAISMVIQFCPDVTTACGGSKEAIKQLTLDRNVTFHSSENEPEDELYLRGILSLYNLRTFVRTVDKCETSIPDAVRQDFRIKSIKKIEDLKDILDDERIELVQINKQMNKNINLILTSDDSLKKWLEVLEYYRKQDALMDNRTHDLEKEFLFKASDLGVKEAHIYAAMLSSRDQKEFEHRLFLAYNTAIADNNASIAFAIVREINYYLSKRYEHILTEQMQIIINGLIDKGFPVSISDDDYILWNDKFECSMKPVNVKKYICFINQMIIKKEKKLSDYQEREIKEYIDNGFPITQSNDGIYLWEGEDVQMEIKPVMIGGKEVYSFD